MDNEKQITVAAAMNQAAVHNEVQLFLRDELLPLAKQNARNVYDLEAEYSKTKKNNSPFIPLVLLGCLAVVGFGALLAVAQIRERDNRISVSLDVFDDVNLKNLIDTVSRTQEMYEQAVKNLSSLEGDFNSRENEAKLKLASDIEIIGSMKLSKKEAMRRKQNVNSEFNKTMADIHAEYDSQLASAKKEADEYKARLAAYDDAKVKSAQEMDKALDSERALQNLERQKLTLKYETRIKKLEDALNDLTKRTVKDKTETVVSVVKKYTDEIEERDKIIGEREETIAERDATISEQEAAIAEKEKNIAALETNVNNLNAKCAAYKERTAELETGIDKLLKARNIAALTLGARNGKVEVYVARDRVSLIAGDGVNATVTYSLAGVKKPIVINGIITKEEMSFLFAALPSDDGRNIDAATIPIGTEVKILSR